MSSIHQLSIPVELYQGLRLVAIQYTCPTTKQNGVRLLKCPCTGRNRKKREKDWGGKKKLDIDSEFEREAVSTVRGLPSERPVRFPFYSALNGRVLSI